MVICVFKGGRSHFFFFCLYARLRFCLQIIKHTCMMCVVCVKYKENLPNCGLCKAKGLEIVSDDFKPSIVHIFGLDLSTN